MFNFGKQKKEPENLKDILEQFADLKADFEALSKELENLKKKNKFSVQKIALKRYNPFKEVGGDQSFSLALLDDNNNGAVITSHYTRQENRVYGKPIKGGKSEYPLSEEEINVIEIAKQSKTNGEK